MIETIERPSPTVVIGVSPLANGGKTPKPTACDTVGTRVSEFDAVKQHLSKKPLRRPTRTFSKAPRVVTNAELKKLAKKHAPALEWLDGDEPCPF
jgi:hypothetical protein